MKKTLLKIVLPLLAVASILLIIGCKKDNNSEKNEGRFHAYSVSFSDCYPETKNTKGRDSIIVNCVDKSIFVEHHNYTLPCGFDTILVSYAFFDDTLAVYEIPDPLLDNNCACEISLSYRLNNIPHGTYVLVLGNYPRYKRYVQTINI